MNKLPSSDDIHGNCKIQLSSIELLTMLCTEMITIVKDMGKGLACYIGDLMTKCKLQKVNHLQLLREICFTIIYIIALFNRRLSSIV